MKDIREYLMETLHAATQKAVPELSITPEEVTVERPKNREFGDFASPLALNLAKRLHANPVDLAKTIVSAAVWDSAYVEADPLPPQTVVGGFINFRLSKEYLLRILRQAAVSPQSFGRNQTRQPKRMLFEFVSANPTGPMVVVNARAAAIGDMLARIHEWLGHTVEREYYINDYGAQVELLGQSIACRYWQQRGRECQIPSGGYEGAYIAELASGISAAYPQLATYSDEELVAFFKAQALERIIAAHQATLARYGVNYTRWFRESTLHASGRVAAVAEQLARQGDTYEREGALWFKATSYGDTKDWVIRRSDGTPTYFLADLAYHADKAARGYDMAHTFWGPDHHGYIPHLMCGLRALGLGVERFRNHLIQQVSLIRDGQPYKMSKRRGDFVTMEDLLNEVGVDAARYFFLMRRLSSHFDFDLNLAVKQSEENPVYYAQYAHARTCSLVRYATEQGIAEETVRETPGALLEEPEAIDVLRAIADFPHTLSQTAESMEPSRLTSYIETLSGRFHLFYQRHRIVTSDRHRSTDRLLLVVGVRNVIGTALALLGVSAPERM